MTPTLLDPPAPRAPASIGEALLTDVPHAEVPEEELRPRRLTPNLELPVPGDSDPADAPTDVGNLADRLDAILSRWIVPGLILPSARIDIPAGWLHCLGQAVSRTAYAALYAAIGDAYGAGDGITTFNLPQLGDGRIPVGSTARGGLGGETQHITTVAEMPHHGHDVYDPSHVHGLADPGHVHLPYEGLEWVDDPQVGFMHWQISGGGTGLFMAEGPPPYRFFFTAPRTRGAAAGIGVHGAATGITLYGQGGGAPHNNMPPYQQCIYLIKT
jgi:microcystin-dependent protein